MHTHGVMRPPPLLYTHTHIHAVCAAATAATAAVCAISFVSIRIKNASINVGCWIRITLAACAHTAPHTMCTI